MRYILFIILFIGNTWILSAQGVGLGTTSPNPSAILDLSSTTSGILIPRMSYVQKTSIVSPADGLLVYDTDIKTFFYYKNNNWVSMLTAKLITDGDGDTKIQVEELPDENTIRMDLDGAEVLTLKRNVNGDVLIAPYGPDRNIFIGRGSGINNEGMDNTATGDSALSFTTVGKYNTAIGSKALLKNSIGDYNTAIGYGSLKNNQTGGENVSIGFKAMFDNSSGVENTAIGYNCLSSNTTGYANTAIGYGSLVSNTSGYNNVANGYASLAFNHTGNHNTANGIGALFFNESGNANTSSGASSLKYNIKGDNNSAFGFEALFSNEAGSNATAVGYHALQFANDQFNTFTNYNVAVGFESLRGSSTASNNTGNYNTAVGYQSLYQFTTGSFNTSIGYVSLRDNTIGHSNTACGYGALSTNTTGIHNSAFGRSAYFDNVSLDNTTCIGYSAGGVVEADNRIEIGNSSVSWIGGQVGWSTYSDARIKEHVMENVAGLSFINLLRPVTYNLNIHKVNEMTHGAEREEGEWDSKYDIENVRMTGFIAQEVEQAATAAGYDFSGLEKPKNENELYSLRYADFVVPLVKAVQEQQAMIEQQNKIIDQQMIIIEQQNKKTELLMNEIMLIKEKLK